MVINKKVLDYKSSYLFSKEEMFPRETVLQTEFNAAFQPIAVRVMSAISSAGDCYNDFIKDHPFMERDNKGFPAFFWNCLIREQLSMLPEIEWDHTNGLSRRFYIKVGNAKLFPKKIDEKYSTVNIETAIVQMYREQLTDDESDTDTVLILGYQFDETKRQIIDIVVVCRRGENIEWVTDVYDLCKSEKIRPTVVSLNVEYAAVSEPSVTPLIKPKPGLAKIKRE